MICFSVCVWIEMFGISFFNDVVWMLCSFVVEVLISMICFLIRGRMLLSCFGLNSFFVEI